MPVLVTRENADLTGSIHEIMDHFQGSLDPARGFFLKPNIVFPVAPNSGEITRPAVLRAVVYALRERFGNADIVIGEGTAAGTVPMENFMISGFQRLAGDLGIPLLDLNEVDRVPVSWRYGELSIPSVALERNHINLPILKWSAAAVMSGAIKNTKGLVAPGLKKVFHKLGLHEPLAELAGIIKPNLTILDCINFRRQQNLFISGDNTIEVDATAIRLLNCETPEYFRIIADNRAKPFDFVITGEDLLVPNAERHIPPKCKRYLNMRLWSNPKACSMCRQTLRRLKSLPYGKESASFFSYLKLLYYAFTGTEIVFGSDAKFEQKSDRVICIGDCTRRLAEENGYLHVPGCPPTLKDVSSNL